MKSGLFGGLEGSVVVEGSEQLYEQVEGRRRAEEKREGGSGKEKGESE